MRNAGTDRLDRLAKYLKQNRMDKRLATNQKTRSLYANYIHVPDAKARIAEAIKQAEQTQRNIDALTEEGDDE
jgi:hypothetical protein